MQRTITQPYLHILSAVKLVNNPISLGIDEIRFVPAAIDQDFTETN